MNLQRLICEAFCTEVRVSPFHGGYGVSTPFADAQTGDLIGFYILGNDRSRYLTIVDDSLTVARFESEGATLESQQRRESFSGILSTYGAVYDDETGELSIRDIPANEIARKSLDFMALLLRLQDMYLLTRDRIENTFLDDVANRLDALNVPGLKIEHKTPVSERLKEVVPDYVLRREGVANPVALFVTSGNEKLWQAMHLKMVSEYEAHEAVSVVALLETDTTGSQPTRAKAANRLDAMPNWRGDEGAALGRVLRELEVASAQSH